ncbi:MAG: serine/threonine protein phosphatase [Flavobacteriales bacterium]|nr:serine/threonine protein phosphatase [Flavobacteriales bacterium]
MRTIVIGDIHGSYLSLKDLLALCEFDNQKDRLICIGDYVDGWPESVELVDFLIDLQKASSDRHVYLKGNHDQWFLDILNKDFLNFENQDLIKAKYFNWIKNGGLSTYESYLAIPDTKREYHRANFYDKLQNFYIENEVLFVHAGFDYKQPFLEGVEFDRNSLFWNRSLFEKAVQIWGLEKEGANTQDVENFGGFKQIFIGHTPTSNYGIEKPIKMHNVINVDQGCKIDGKLSGWVLETGEYYQSKKRV